jgi:hypothetical protein
MSDTPDRDPCDDLLRVGPPPADERLRGAVWRRMQGRLRRRRWLRRAAVAAALAACYVIGFGTGRLGREQVPTQSAAPPGERPTEASLSASSALDLEWRALDSPKPRPDLARQAGDRYAAEEGDYPSALRCYREVLDAGSDRDRAIAPGDSWLLMVLKDARQKEKRDANLQN